MKSENDEFSELTFSVTLHSYSLKLFILSKKMKSYEQKMLNDNKTKKLTKEKHS